MPAFTLDQFLERLRELLERDVDLDVAETRETSGPRGLIVTLVDGTTFALTAQRRD